MDNVVDERKKIESSKRGKMLFLSFSLTFAVFAMKLFMGEFSLLQMYVLSVVAFLITYAGLMWIVDFDLNKKSLLLYVPQGALFVCAEVLFWIIFFPLKFGRLSEVTLMFGILLCFFIATYAACLMVNIFAVSSVKQIPLVQVAKTTSNILSLFTIYLFAFSLYASEFFIGFLIIVLVAVFFIVVAQHYAHLGLANRTYARSVMIAVWCMSVSTIGVSFAGGKHEFLAFVPVVIMYVVGDIVERNEKQKHPLFSILLNILIGILVASANIFQW